MKKFFYISLVFLLASVYGFAQITINVSDMPVAGDTLRVSIATNIPEGFDKTGMDTTWDFSFLLPLNQRLDSFVAATSTPPEFWLFFVPGIETNLASPRSGGFIPGIPITDSYTFFNKTPNSFIDLGYAVKVQGIPLPLKYDKADVYYELPFHILSDWSSESAYSINIPTIGYYGVQRIRTSTVDGWGNLITPFGTFPTLRVKSNILQDDTIYIDSLQLGLVINRDITEYKWLGKGQGIPLLTIIQEGPVVSAKYRDIPRLPITPFSIYLGPDTSVTKGATIDLKATIKGGTPPYYVIWNTLDTGMVLTVIIDSTTTFTAVGIDASFNFVSDSKVVTAVNAGVEEKQPSLLRIFPNPAEDRLTIEVPVPVYTADLTVQSSQGQNIFSKRVSQLINRSCDLDVNGFSPGLYIIRITSEQSIYFGKFVKE